MGKIPIHITFTCTTVGDSYSPGCICSVVMSGLFVPTPPTSHCVPSVSVSRKATAVVREWRTLQRAVILVVCSRKPFSMFSVTSASAISVKQNVSVRGVCSRANAA